MPGFRLPAPTPKDSERLGHSRVGDRLWRSPDELGEPSQVLRRCGEQHFILRTTQVPQAQSVELVDALHVREPYLHFFALTARDWKASVLASARERLQDRG